MANPEQVDLLKQGVKVWNKWRNENPKALIDLTKADLAGSDLSGSNLNRAKLSKANLNGTNLSEANLTMANLYRAELGNSNLSNANLTSASLLRANFNKIGLTFVPDDPTFRSYGSFARMRYLHSAESVDFFQPAYLWRTNFTKANLSQACLMEAHVKQCNFSKANLSEAFLNGSNFEFANLANANLSKAFLNFTELHFAKFNKANLNEAELGKADLYAANLSNATLVGTLLQDANLQIVNLHAANLEKAILVDADLSCDPIDGLDPTDLSKANLAEADLHGARLLHTRLSGANLFRTNLSGALLNSADLSQAKLTDTNLQGASLIEAKVDKAIISGSSIYGINVWGLKGEFEEQKDLIVTREGDSVITVDNIKVAQFIYLILNNEEIRDVINTLTSKTVLILGRFSIPERKIVLDALRNKLREYNLIPIVFDFDRPIDKDITETIKTLAGMSFFVIADITNPKSSPLELQATIPDYQVPFAPIIQEGEEPFSMMANLQSKYNWVLDTLSYDSAETLINALKSAIIDPAIQKHNELRVIKAQKPKIRSVNDFLNENKTDA